MIKKLWNKIKIDKLSKVETTITIGLVLTFILDLLSTIFFINLGQGDLEANIIIYFMGWSSLYVVLLLNVVVIWLLIKIIQKSKGADWKISLSFVNTFILFRFLVACNNVASSLTHVGEVIKPTLITILKGYLNLYLLLALMFFTAKISVEMVQKIQKKGDKI